MSAGKAVMRVVSICLRVSVFVLIALGILYLGQQAFRYTHAIFSDQAMEEEPGRAVKLQLKEPIAGKKLAKFLEKKEVVKDADIFYIQMKYYGLGGQVETGIYELNTSMPPSELIKILSGEEKDT